MLKLLVGLSSILALLTAPAVPQLEAHFATPSIVGTTDDSLEDKLLELIGQADDGSSIHLATMVMQSEAVKLALVAAKRDRGVDVQIIAEAAKPHPLLDELATELGPGHVTLCQDGCNNRAGEIDVMHHKFFVFSRLADGRTDVVVQSSQNLSSEFGLHNNMLISTGDAGLAAGYLEVFSKLRARTPHTWTTPFTSGSGKISVWMTPRALTDDPLEAAITGVNCPGSIRIAHSQFSTDRPGVIAALKDKKDQGCSVQVIVPEGNQTTDAARELAKGGIVVYSFRPGGCHEGVQPADPNVGPCDVDNIHSKILLIEDASKRHVYTGSHNIVGGSLTKSDDSIVRVDDPAIYAAYDANYDLLLAKVIRFVPSAYPNAALQMAANGPEDQRTPRAAAERNGYTAVAWESASEVFARIYRNGQPVTGPVKVSMGGVGCATGWNHVQPSAGVDDQGNAYVAWAEDGDCRGEHNVAVRRLSAAGQLSATIWANNPQWAGDQVRPRIAVTGPGAFTLVWEDAASATVRAAGYSSLTARVFGPIQVSAGNRPDVAVDGSGVATVVWQQAPDVYGTRISATGATTAGRTKINSNAAGQHLAPAVATTPAGAVVVAWSDNVNDVWRVRVRGFTSALAGRFGERAVAAGVIAKGEDGRNQSREYPPACHFATCAVQGSASIAAAADGRFVVGWTESDIWNSARSYEVYAKGFNADASTGGSFRLQRMNPNTVGNQFATAVTAGPGGFTYFYTEDFDVNDYADIVARTGFTNTGF